LQLELTYPPKQFDQMVSCEPAEDDKNQIVCSATVKAGEVLGWITAKNATGYKRYWRNYKS